MKRLLVIVASLIVVVSIGLSLGTESICQETEEFIILEKFKEHPEIYEFIKNEPEVLLFLEQNPDFADYLSKNPKIVKSIIESPDPEQKTQIFIQFLSAEMEYKRLARVYWDMGEHKKAEKKFKKALELAPQDIEVLIGLGIAYHAQNKYDNAIFWYEKALEVKPDSARVLNNLANAYLRMEEYQKAIYYIQKVLEIEPDMWIARANLGEIYLAQGYHFMALAELENAMQSASPRLKQYIQDLIDKATELIQPGEPAERM